MSTATKWTDPFEDMSDEEFDEHVDLASVPKLEPRR